MSALLGETISQIVSDGVRSPWTPATDERIVVYGAGDFARATVGALGQVGAVVHHALDRRGNSASLGEIDVFRPDDDPMSVRDRRVATAIVGVFNRAADPFEIERFLKASGYGRVVGVPELYETFAESLGPRYWLSSRSLYQQYDEQISAGLGLWADAASRELYQSVIRYRLAWNAADAPRPCAGLQYFPDDVPRSTGPLEWVDCGAYDGDSLAAIASLGGTVAAAYAFEPDLDNFARLVRRAREVAEVTGARVSLWPCAVAGATGLRPFHGAAGEASAIGRDGTSFVSAIAIDDVLPNVGVTDLKMDIEGAELEALRGAERLIRRCRPRLAICVYHQPQDLWEIPLYVRSLGLPLDFYLRSHGHYGFDLVMYAVPHVR